MTANHKKRILLKLSGEALSLEGHRGINPQSLKEIATEIADAYKKAKKNVYGYLGYGKSNSIDSGMNTFKKLKTSAEKVTFFKLCLAVRMNYQDANDFLNFFGYSFASAGINKTDDAMRQILFKHIYGVVEVNKEWEEAGLNPPLFKWK